MFHAEEFRVFVGKKVLNAFFSEYGVQCIDLKIKILKYYMDIVA